MCSRGVFLQTYVSVSTKSSSTCSGVFDNKRSKSVSVIIFSGMRLSMAIFNGRMSCEVALLWSITKIFSLRNSSTAGSDTGTVTGILYYPFSIFSSFIAQIYFIHSVSAMLLSSLNIVIASALPAFTNSGKWASLLKTTGASYFLSKCQNC